MNVVVIGAGPGIGTAVACRFARAGWGVGLVARSPGTLERATAQVTDTAGGETTVIGEAGDAADRASLVTALDQVEGRLGPIDVLVYNAVSAPVGTGTTLEPAALLDSLAVNVVGALVAAQWAVPRMTARGGGTILLTGGGLAYEAWPAFAAVGAGKAALRNLTQALHKELTTTGVRVGMVSVMGTVAPGGPFDPDLIAEEFWDMCSLPAAEWQWERRCGGRAG